MKSNYRFRHQILYCAVSHYACALRSDPVATALTETANRTLSLITFVHVVL